MSICVNSKVIDKYKSGMSLNDSIAEVHAGEIQDKIKQNVAFEKMTPLQMVMHDAGINKYSTVGDIMDSAMYTSSGMDSNEWLFPAWVESTIREATYDQSIMSYLVTTSQGVDSNIVKAATLNMLSDVNKPNLKKARIAEGADLPLAKIVLGEQAITLWKHGRAIEMTYEAVRRIRIDLFTRHMNAIINDMAFQNLDLAVDVLVNGDGNTGSAATKLGTTGTAGTITNTEIVGFLMDYWFKNHYNADTIVTSLAMAKKIGAMFFDTNLSAGASAQVRFNMPQFQNTQNVTVLAADVPKIGGKDAIVLMNRANTLLRYTENGSNIQENQQFARNQTRLLTVSENSGYAIGVTGSNMYIEVLSA